MDSVLILKAASGRLTKTVRPGDVVPYDDVTYFYDTQQAIGDLQDLHKLLVKLSRKPDLAVIRGERRPKDQIVAAERVRAARALPTDAIPLCTMDDAQRVLFRRSKRVYQDTPQSWVALDIDGFQTAADPLANPVTAAQQYIRSELPAPFLGVSYILQHTSSSGIKPGLRCRLWFWLNEPRMSAEWYVWSDGRALDRALFRPVQLHYTAAPIFDGVEDPVRDRVILVEGPLGDMVDVSRLTMARMDQISANLPSEDTAEDAHSRPGMIGAFNRAFPISEVIAEFLPDVFEDLGGGRVTYLGAASGTPGGARIFADDSKLFNSHASDPRGGQPANAYELVLVHKFDGDLGAMDAWIASEHPAVAEDAARAIAEEFADAEDIQTLDEAQTGDPYGWVGWFNRRYALVSEHGRVCVMRQGLDPALGWPVWLRITLTDFRAMYMNRQVAVRQTKKGFQTEPAGDAWLAHPDRRQYIGGVTYAIKPAQGTVPGNVLNLWQPPTWSPSVPPSADPAPVQPWLDLLAALVPDPDAAHYLIQRFAALVQCPERKRNSAIILGSAPGAGKDTLLGPIKYGLGPWNVNYVTSEMLDEKYNDWLVGRKLLILEEIKHRDRWDITNKMLTWIAAPPETIQIRRMHTPVFSIPNIVEFIGLTNHPDALALRADDRRWWVWWSPHTKEDFARDHQHMPAWIRQPRNLEAVVTWLRAVQIDEGLVYGSPPMTSAKMEMVAQNRPLAEQVIADMLEDEHPLTQCDLVSAADVADAVSDSLRGRNKLTAATIARCLVAVGAEPLGRVRVNQTVRGGIRECTYGRVSLFAWRRADMYRSAGEANLAAIFVKQRTKVLEALAAQVG